jgi:spore maturation protein CgeB
MTLNFSMASSGAHQQLKWRVIEATLAGSLLLTDDRDRTREFFAPQREFDSFDSSADLARVIEQWLSRPDHLRAAQKRGQQRARALATLELWTLLGRVLEMRSLPRLPEFTT